MDIDALWLHTLQAICSRAAHEIKGALNGVAVNVEVVRSRAERGDAVVADVHRFTRSAADQLGALIAMTEGVLNLARAGREPADLVQVTRQLVAVLGPAEHTAGRTLELGGTPGDSAPTGAPASAVRLVIAAGLLAGAERRGAVVCRVHVSMLRVDITPGFLDDPGLREAVEAVATIGITVKTDGHGISIGFPPIGHHGTPLEVV